MKVIKQSKIPIYQVYQVKCIRCGSIVEYNDTEEQEKFTKNVAWFGDCTDWSIKCPICGINIPTRTLTNDGYDDWRIKTE